MAYRKTPLCVGEVYHVFTRSIAGFTIFNSPYDYMRMRDVMFYYSVKDPPCRFCFFAEKSPRMSLIDFLNRQNNKPLIQIIAYCLMPTHVHLVIKEVEENGLSGYMNIVLKSYTKYFNCKYKRKGPLWEGRFKNVRVESDEQLIHLTRYVHLNPVSAGLIEQPDSWEHSSYRQYVGYNKGLTNLLKCPGLLNIKDYKGFVEDQRDYQRSLERIKHLVAE